MNGEQLNEYKKKRDFEKTKEPRSREGSNSQDENIFVIQKHFASSLHYDFRLEVDGVLKSWAVPKGPSLNSSEKRLAILVEDHPLDYADFEGVIPEGEYGAGEVIIWDNGTYENISAKKEEEKTMQEMLKTGLIEIFLKGQKLYGGYALKRMGKENEKNWLLIKENDEYARSEEGLLGIDESSVVSNKKSNEEN